VSKKALASIFLNTRGRNQISQNVLGLIRVSFMLGDPLASFDPVVECPTFFIIGNVCQNRHHLISQLFCVADKDSSQPFFDATKQVEVADGEIWGIRRMWNSSTPQTRHRVRNHL
jgi:hypothetical protein